MIVPHLKNTMTLMDRVIQCFQRKRCHKYFTFQLIITSFAKHEKGKQNQVKFIQQTTVDEILNDIAYDQLIGIPRFQEI